IAISEVTRSLLLEQGVPPKKISLLHHGFDLEKMQEKNAINIQRLQQKYNPNAQSPIIGVIARWVDWKGIQFIIPAFQRVLKDYPNAKLFLFNASVKSSYSAPLLEALKTIPDSN